MGLRTGVNVVRGPGARAAREGRREGAAGGSGVGAARSRAVLAEAAKAAFSLQSLPVLALAFLVGRATVLQAVSPFGVAFFAAVLAAQPRRAPGVALAAAAGVLSTAAADSALDFGGAVLGLALLHLAFDRGARRPRPVTWAALAFTVTAAAGSVRAVLLDPTPYRFLLAFFAGLVTFVLTLVYLTALPAVSFLRRPANLGPEQIISLALMTATALAGLSGLGYAGLRAFGVAGGLVILVAAAVAGPGVGAATGTVSGVVAALCGTAGLSGVGLAAMSGLLAGSFRDLGKAGTAAGYFFGTLLLSPLIEEAHYLEAVVFEAALAVGLFLILPRRFWQPLGSALRTAGPGQSPVVAENSARQTVGRRLTDLGLVFSQLAATLKEVSAAGPASAGAPPAPAGEPTPAGTAPAAAGSGSAAVSASAAVTPSSSAPSAETAARDTQSLADAACRVCQACRLFKACWKGELDRTRGALSSLLEVTAERGQLETRDVPAQLRRRCVHLGELVTTMNFLHEMAALNRHWRKKLEESRGLVSQQLDGLAHILRQLGQGLTADVMDDAGLVEELVQNLDRAGFPVREVSVERVPGGHAEFLVRADNCATGDACREIVLPAAATLTGCRLVAADLDCGLAAGRDGCSFRLTAPRQLEFQVGVTQARKSSSSVSGDSYLIRELPGNRLAAVLSDGTGAGPRAAEESRTTLRMLEELLKLGFSTETAVRTINSMLLLRSATERFATLDLFTVDLYDGQARFVKVGAPPSYLRRGREVSVIHSANLPLGVLPEVSTEGYTLTIRPGDLIVLATDGLVSSQPAKPGSPAETWITGFLRELGELGPQEVSDALVEAAVSLSCNRLPAVAGGSTGLPGHRALRDDITVMALTFGPSDEV